MKFLDIRTDFAFKKVFGVVDSAQHILPFPNSTIHFTDNAQIIDVNSGVAIEIISQASGLSVAEIEKLLSNNVIST